MTTTRTFEVLRQLLDRVPANKLDHLLDAANLIKLLQLYGYEKDALAQRLKSGTLPGDLLLELLDKEPDADKLLAQLGITHVEPMKPAKPVASTPSTPSTMPVGSVVPETIKPTGDPLPAPSTPPITAPSPSSTGTTATGTPSIPATKGRGNLLGKYYGVVVIAILALTCIVPAFVLSGFFPVLQKMSVETAMLIAVVGGAVAGGLADGNAIFSWKGMIVGAVYSLGTLWATTYYTRLRTWILRIEIIIPMTLGGIPALFVWFLLSKVGKKKSATG